MTLQQTAAHLPSPLAGLTVLCAMPDESVHPFIADVLAPAHVHFAVNGYQALACRNVASFDAYLLDYWLPDWRGTTFCRDIRKTDPNAAVFFYTRAGSADALKRSMRAGADLVLKAPIDRTLLRARIENIVTARTAASERALGSAKAAAEQAIDVRAGRIRLVSADSLAGAIAIIERRARAAALDAFLTAGGTRAYFERAWPALYQRAATRLPRVAENA